MARQHRGFTLVELPAVSRRKCAAFTLVELPVVSGRKRAAFTLVELLVVVAILAIILSMLLPALRAAREAGWSGACKSNQHQIGLAIAVYRQEYRGVYPPYREYQLRVESSTGTSAIHQLWGHKNYDPFTMFDPNGDPDTGINVPDVRIGFLAPYIQRSKKLLTCPSYRDMAFLPSYGPPMFLNSYALNLWMGGFNAPTGGGVWNGTITLRNESHLQRASKIINYADGTGHRLYLWWPSDSVRLGVGPGVYLEDDPNAMRTAPWNRHMGLANFLFADSHVKDQDAANWWWDEYWIND